MPELRAERGIELDPRPSVGVPNEVFVRFRRPGYRIINGLEDFPEPDNGVITLEPLFYDIAGNIDIGSNRIVMVEGSVICGRDIAHDTIVSTTTDAVITADNIGLTVLREFNIAAPAGECVHLENGIGEQLNMFYIGMFGNKAGTVKGYDVQAFKACFIDCAEGLHFGGTTNKVFVSETPFYGVTSGNAAITLDADLDAAVIDIRVSYYKFDDGVGLRAEEGYSVGDARYDSNLIDGDLTPLEGVSPADIAWSMTNNTGVRNSRTVGKISRNTDLLVPIATSATPVRITGATEESPFNERFVDGDFTLTYTGISPTLVTVTGTFTVSGGNNVTIRVWLAVNGVIETDTESRLRVGTGADERTGAVAGVLALEPGDAVQVWIANSTNTQDITLRSFTMVARA